MSAHKYSKETKTENRKLLAIIAGIVVVVIVLVVAFAMTRENSMDKGDTTKTISYDLDHNLEITSISSYTGPFLEDGSDEEVSDILAISLTNNGTQTLQYAELTLAFGNDTAEFAFSTLAPGEKMVVLEENRLNYSKGMSEIIEARLDNVVFFSEELSLCQNRIQVQTLDGALNIKNISEADITGRVVVYYKNYVDGIYQGGITYRIIVEDGIEAGGIKQVMTNHFSVDNSKIVFVTCEP